MKAVNCLPEMNFMTISDIEHDSIAEEVGLEPGDELVRINNEMVRDVIDYYNLSASETLELEVRKADGETWMISIEKDVDEHLGIRFITDIPGKIRQCSNKCIFCFVDQQPRGLRKSLYIKDDDFRHSFLHGNYISLTNLDSADWERIMEMHLSPLYISIHTTNPRLRSKMMGNPDASGIIPQLQKLAEAGIRIHGQVVVCPGINDGDQLERTLNDLALLWPSVSSVAVVPVGITKFQRFRLPFFPVDHGSAKDTIDLVSELQRGFKLTLGTSFAFPADEFFLKAGREIPSMEYYEDFPQIENGVGLIRILLDEFNGLLPKTPRSLPEERHILLVTGTAMGPIMNRLSGQLNRRVEGLRVEVLPVVNSFFGETVDVTGLLTGGDIIDALLKHRDGYLRPGGKVVISRIMLKWGDNIFIDGLKPQDVEKRTGMELTIVDDNARGLLTGVLGQEVRN
ncbi:MAG: DUF512 domain-containing protein [Clostridia bacterium]|nr:DUF512 domain-containing protein [Clostridia bacterium]